MGPPSGFKLIMREGPTPGQEFEFSESTITAGREDHPEVNLRIDSPAISRRHARITYQAGTWRIEDLRSSNGTFLNDQRIQGSSVALNPGDEVRLASSVMLIAEFSEQASGSKPEVPLMATVVGEEVEFPTLAQPPELIVTVAGDEPSRYPMTKSSITLGRSPENDIIIGSKIVSRRQAKIEQVYGGYQILVEPDAGNPVLFEGRPLTGPHFLTHGDLLRIGSLDPGVMVSIQYESPATAGTSPPLQPIRFGTKSQLQFGRDPNNDVILEAPTVSRFHTQIERIGQRYRIRDLRSSNATFVNEQRIEGDVWLKSSDSIRIGPYRFVMGEDELEQYDESGGLRADAIHLNKWVRKDLNILQDISVVFKPREFIVIVGQSGGGKSTLLDAIAGYRPATDGQVLINDVDAYRNFDAVRNHIGYVPQKDIIHMELTVYQALDYAARLRMPKDTSSEERHTRILAVLEDLDLLHRKDVQVSGLSGGQQKRVSIGVELLTKPGLFFLDEATSGLDPGTETALMQLMRRLADQGRTIVLVTHATKNVMLADKVLFLARGGYLAWFGPPDEALDYFDRHRTERERRTSSMEFDKIYAILDNPTQGSPSEWAARFREHPTYRKCIADPIAEKQADIEPIKSPAARRSKVAKERPQISAMRQFLILSSRNMKILTRDRISLLLMLGAAPLVSLLDVLVGSISGRTPFDFNEGNIEDVITSFFLVIIFAIFVGGLSQMREFVKENDVYKRERLVNLKLMPYVLSKIWVAILLALYQAAVYVGVHYATYEMPGGTNEFILMYVTTVLLVGSGMMLGLFASALSPNANSVPMLVILLVLPQIVLSGALVPLPSAVSSPASTRWAFEAFMATTGPGSDVAADICWQLPEDVAGEMSIDEATSQCNCMGLNALYESTCNFPGLGQFYDPAIERPKPLEPDPLRAKPEEPEFPPAPEPPADQSDTVAMAQYFEDLQDYQAEVEILQDQFRMDLQAYEREADLYTAEITAYQEDLLDWEITRTAAVDPAVGVIRRIDDEFGWTFVDKENSGAFRSKIGTAWGVMSAIILILTSGVVWIVKRKDVV